MSLVEKPNKMAIGESDYVLLRKNANMKVVQVLRNKAVNMCKMKFCLDGIIGHSFGSSFRMQNGQLEKVDFKELNAEANDKDDEVENSEGRDNRSLIDRRENQKLSKDEITSLRKQGVTGEEIVDQLVENSATFQQKTEFSQQKYIQKKKKKHVPVFTVLRPTTRTLIEMYYSRGPTKICNLRMDSLAQILTQADVRSSSKLMVVESCSGLVLGAILERLAGNGAVVHLYTGSAPTRPALTEGYNFSAEHLQTLYSFPLDQVSKLQRPFQTSEDSPVSGNDVIMSTQDDLQADTVSSETTTSCLNEKASSAEDKAVAEQAEPSTQVSSVQEEAVQDSQAKESAEREKGGNRSNWKKRKFDDTEEREKRKTERLAQQQKAKTLIESAKMDGLIIAAKVHPTPIVMSLIDYVQPSRPIVVFSPYKEPLMDCFVKLRERGGVLMLKLSETWFREYQVLPDRTHPTINMSGSGGYLLTATTVALA